MAAKKTNKKQRSSVKSNSLPKFAGVFLIIIIAITGFFANEYFPFDSKGSPAVEGIADFHFIDVGQGDGILIITDSGNILIDAGPASASGYLNSYLDEYSVNDIEYAIFTHPHEDHIGGATSVINSRNVKNVIIPDIEYDSKTYDRLLTALEESVNTNIIPPTSGEVYSVGDLCIQILAPNSAVYKSTNNYSIVAKITYGSTSFILTGDAEILSENEILSLYSKSELKCDVLKIGHHGSTTSSGTAFLDAVSPSIAVISCGAGNEYGHPNIETLDNLTTKNITVYRTDILGSFILTTDGTTVALK